MLPLIVVDLLVHLYVGARLIPAFDWPLAPTLIAVAVLIFSALAIPYGLMARRLGRGDDALTWPSLVTMGWFASLWVGTATRDVLLLAGNVLDFIAPQVLDLGQLARFAHESALAVPLLALAASVFGFLNARRTARVVAIDVPITGLSDALTGFRIVQISDIHVGPTIKRAYLEAIVKRVNALNPDVVAITGDLVDGSVAELAAHVAPLAQLRARHGVYFVTGNHEYYSGAPAWVAELRRLGITVLMNEHVLLEHDGSPLVVAGVTDYGAHHFDPAQRSDPRGALLGLAAGDVPKVLLAHQPRSALAAEEAGFDLQLSGHTHGGQFFPWNLFVRLQQPFTAGLHRLGGLWVYTSRGTGYWGPPKRLFAPSEITQVSLVPAA
jgi:predicted MPP superfamily phosphohydrolase